MRAEETKLRKGFTTGSCAAAAAKAAAFMLLSGRKKERIRITTPAGICYEPEILEIHSVTNACGETEAVSCGVKKDGGDDPDVTTGCLICAEVRRQKEPGITIDGGTGVGRVTKPGLDQPVGNAAINHVPREMIGREVAEVCRLMDYEGGLSVIISVPDGERVAERTFNPRLGIVGGISIIGTTGIVEPMSSQAILDTIKVELSQRKALGYELVSVTPGNYGRDYMNQAYGYDIDASVKCSNFIGSTIDLAAGLGLKKLLLTGHIGKLVKVAGGIMNTHSKEGDCRMELLAAAAIREGADAATALRILNCLVTEEGLGILKEAGLLEPVCARLMERILFYLRKRAAGRLEIECVMYSNDYGELARSEGAEPWLILLAQEQGQRT